MDKLKVRRTPSEAKAVLTQRRVAAQARADEAIDALAAAAALHRHEEAMRVLEQIILRGGSLRLERLEDLVQPWLWITDAQGCIVDHVLMAESTALEEAIAEERFTVLPLGETLQRPWRELGVKSRWISAYADTLRAVADRADAELQALRSAQGLRGVFDDFSDQV
ncbi:MAG: hypothetical protein AAGC76_04955 [Luteibacter sp.]|uniref:hypothetical protein n=1 Tax=Luteibacter sp. TaxID=1886636 RepID=UPI00280686D0|nr:hypothetical protein [Luteibacter sp.]MDQ7995185.1 hypothetical protein [Luteibacter sp.]